MQRETPRDDLRALSRCIHPSSFLYHLRTREADTIDVVLAKKPKAASPRERPTPRRRRSSLVDKEDSPAIDQAPRLSLNPRDLDDDSFHEQPPRLSYPLDDDEDEIETRRRAALGRARERQSLASVIDPSLVDLDGMATDDYGDITEARQRLLEQDMSINVDDIDDDGETAELRAMLDAQAAGVDQTEITDGEPTFLFRIPERSRLSLAPTVGVPRTPEGQVADDDADDGYEDVDDDEDEEAVVGAEIEYDDDDVPMADGGDLDNEPLREASIPLEDADEEAQARATAGIPKAKLAPRRLPKELKISRHGIEYPSVPPAVVKRLANTFSKQYGGSGKLSKDTLASIQQASDWFMEQVSEDLGEYAEHAGRKTIEESDVVVLMKRYVVTTSLSIALAATYVADGMCTDACTDMSMIQAALAEPEHHALLVGIQISSSRTSAGDSHAASAGEGQEAKTHGSEKEAYEHYRRG